MVRVGPQRIIPDGHTVTTIAPSTARTKMVITRLEGENDGSWREFFITSG
jgi:hypothetical protein